MAEGPRDTPEKFLKPERDVYSLSRVIEEAAIASQLPELEDIQRGTYPTRILYFARKAGVEAIKLPPLDDGSRRPYPHNDQGGRKVFTYDAQRLIAAEALRTWNPVRKFKSPPPELLERYALVRKLWMEKIEELLIQNTL